MKNTGLVQHLLNFTKGLCCISPRLHNTIWCLKCFVIRVILSWVVPEHFCSSVLRYLCTSFVLCELMSVAQWHFVQYNTAGTHGVKRQRVEWKCIRNKLSLLFTWSDDYWIKEPSVYTGRKCWYQKRWLYLFVFFFSFNLTCLWLLTVGSDRILVPKSISWFQRCIVWMEKKL